MPKHIIYSGQQYLQALDDPLVLFDPDVLLEGHDLKDIQTVDALKEQHRLLYLPKHAKSAVLPIHIYIDEEPPAPIAQHLGAPIVHVQPLTLHSKEIALSTLNAIQPKEKNEKAPFAVKDTFPLDLKDYTVTAYQATYPQTHLNQFELDLPVLEHSLKRDRMQLKAQQILKNSYATIIMVGLVTLGLYMATILTLPAVLVVGFLLALFIGGMWAMAFGLKREANKLDRAHQITPRMQKMLAIIREHLPETVIVLTAKK